MTLNCDGQNGSFTLADRNSLDKITYLLVVKDL